MNISKALFFLIISVTVFFTCSSHAISRESRLSRGEIVSAPASSGSGVLEYAPNRIIVKLRDSVVERLQEQGQIETTVTKPTLAGRLESLWPKYRVKKVQPLFRNFKQRRRRLEFLREKSESLLTEKEKHIVRRLKRAPKRARILDLSGIYKVELELKPGQSLEEVIEAYRKSPEVEYVERDYVVSAATIPNDFLYPLQWGLNNTGQDYPVSCGCEWRHGSYDSDIDAPEAWDISRGNGDIVVAVLDTGVDYTHRDLKGNMWTDSNGCYGYDFINDDNDPMDDYGHGTHCAGIIGASGDNGYEIAGVCWNVKIMALKFLNSYGFGFSSDAVSALYYAVENGADVISNSWGGDEYSETMEEAIDYACSQGVVMVAAAGNEDSNQPYYPAYYEHVIAVAATDSNDEKASFSNYGDWVDIAAPGAHILSLRAKSTSMPRPYDAYTTVTSGTSMACPYVGGACALLLSVNPTLTADELRNVLLDTADPIASGICLSNGRLNVFNAVYSVVGSKGVISADTIGISLADRDLEGEANQDVSITTSDGDLEKVVLTETVGAACVFTGSISTGLGPVTIGDGVVQTADNEIIAGIYYDQDDGSRGQTVAICSAGTDCCSPAISSVEIDVPGPEPAVSFQTNEPTTARVLCGVDCGQPNDITVTSSYPGTAHTIKLKGVSAETDYFFVIEATDIVGNNVIDANEGKCYAFTTDSPGDIYVPGDWPTIQRAIDVCWDTGKVWVADGTYTGDGNRDIDFKGRAITLRSENGPNDCIIDVQGSVDESHRGFYFHSNEDHNSVLEGFTIVNADCNKACYNKWSGGGIYCDDSSPTIRNCIIRNNTANTGGGGIYCRSGSPIISDCIIDRNESYTTGGGIYCQSGEPIVRNCRITNNRCFKAGNSAFYSWHSNPTISNCIISNNPTSASTYADIYCYGGDAMLLNCTIVDGRSASFGWMIEVDTCSMDVVNSIIRPGLKTAFSSKNATLSVSYSNVQQGKHAILADNSQVLWGAGNIDVDPCFVSIGCWVDANDPNIPVEGKDPNAIWVGGDYHLKSEGWRWDAGNSKWVYDEVTSRCIDAGSLGWALGEEPLSVSDDPNRLRGRNIRINMGAYGGTSEASIPPYDWVLLGDLTNDGLVGFDDYAFQTTDWLRSVPYQPGDLNRDGIVDLEDLFLLADDWLKQTVWHE